MSSLFQHWYICVNWSTKSYCKWTYAWEKFKPPQLLFAVTEFNAAAMVKSVKGRCCCKSWEQIWGEKNWCYRSRAGRTGWQDAGYERAWGAVLAAQLHQSQSPVAQLREYRQPHRGLGDMGQWQAAEGLMFVCICVWMGVCYQSQARAEESIVSDCMQWIQTATLE